MVERDLCIDDRFRMRDLTEEELQGLRESIKSEGRVRDAIIYWHDGQRNVIIDGINRWTIVQGTDIPFRTEPMVFKCFGEAKAWAIGNQLNRRNTDTAETRNLRGELFQLEKGMGEGAAARVAEQTHVSERTVQRDGARVEKLDKLVPAARKIAEQASDKELSALASLPPDQQNVVAREVRVGQSTLADAIKAAPAPPKKDVPPLLRKYERAHWLKQWNNQIGHLVRLVDKIATEVEETKCKSHKTVQDLLEVATEEMQEWLGGGK